MHKSFTVGGLRFRTALLPADVPLTLMSLDPEVQAILDQLIIAGTYPDTRDRVGDFKPTFKIEIARKAP